MKFVCSSFIWGFIFFRFELTQVLCILSQSLRVHMFQCPVMFKGHRFCGINHHLWLLTVFLILLPKDPWTVEGGVWYVGPTQGPALHKSLHSLHIDELRVSASVVICLKKFPWWGLRHTLICGYSNKSLGITLTLNPFSSRRVITCLPRLRYA